MATKTRVVREDRLDAQAAALIRSASSEVRAALAGVLPSGSGSAPAGVVSSVRQSPDGSWTSPVRTNGAGPVIWVGSGLPGATVGAQAKDLAMIDGGVWECTTSNVWRNIITGEVRTTGATGTAPAAALVRPVAQLGAEGTWATTGNASLTSVLSDEQSTTSATGTPLSGGSTVSLTMRMGSFAHTIGNNVAVTLVGASSSAAGQVTVDLLGAGVSLASKSVPVTVSAGQVVATFLASELPARASWADVEVRVSRVAGSLTLADLVVQSTAPSTGGVPAGVSVDSSLLRVKTGSSWYQDVSAGAPAADSAAKVAALASAVGATPVLLAAYAGTPVWIAPAGTPTVALSYVDTGRGNATLMRNGAGTGVLDRVPIPAWVTPPENPSKTLVVWAPDSDQLWELSGVTKAGGSWSASWGGRIDQVSQSGGAHSGLLGYTGSGLSDAVASVKVEDVARGLREGRSDVIRHTVGVLLPSTGGAFSWPGIRSDGTNVNVAIAQGQRLRLAASFDVAASSLTPIGKMIATAAKTYGLVVVGQSAAPMVLAESGDPARVVKGSNPWDGLLGSSTAANVLAGFPVGSLQLMPMNFGQDGNLGTPTGTAGAKALATLGPTRSGLPWHSGVWIGSPHSPARVDGFGTWRGRPTDVVLGYPNWATESGLMSSEWNASVFNAFTGRLLYAIPMVPQDGGYTYAQVASGAKDAVFTKLAQDLVANGRGNAIVRLGWDLNGPAAGWRVASAGAATFIAAFRRAVTVMRAVSANFRFMFAVKAGVALTDSADRTAALTQLYPGDDVVDIIGLDVYDTGTTAADSSAAWDANVAANGTGPGLSDLLSFAASKNKGVGLPEWGLYGRTNPVYVQKMYDWLNTNSAVAVLDMYFNEAGAPFSGSIYDPNNNATTATAYQGKWSTGVVTPPVVVNPPADGSVMPWPANKVEVYKKMFNSDGPNISAIHSSANVIILSFANQSSGRLRLCGYGAEGKASTVAAIKAKRAAGVRVILGIGGGGYPINVSDVNGFVSDVQFIINDLGTPLDGLDWDIEHNADPTNIGLISKRCAEIYGPNFKSGVTIGGINGDLDKQNRIQQGLQIQGHGLLARFAMQCYDWDGWASPSWYSILRGEYQRYLNDGIQLQALAIGMMVGPEAIYWTLQKCHDGMAQLKADLGVTGAALWEASRAGTDAWITDMRSILGA